MFDLDRWQEIYSSLKHNKLRTFLTVFGVFWGIFMLMIMLGSSNGLTNGVTEGMKSFATNSAFVWTQRTTKPYKGFQRGRRWNFTNSDMIDIRKNIHEISELAPRLQGWGGDGSNNAIRGLKSGSFTISGDYPQINKIDAVSILKGRFLNNVDILEKRKICVIGSHVKDVLFENDEEAVGKYIKIQNVYFKVVGVFKPKNTKVNIGGEKDKTIFLPFTTLQQTYNYGDVVHYFAVTAKKGIPVAQIEDKVIKLLKKRHKIDPTDEQAVGHFNVEKEVRKINILFTGMSVLIWIVGIGTLLAGVIGISNIMLVVVKERTKEIGIKRAIGATPRKVIGQIISESVFLTTIAGYSGLVIGVGIVQGINLILQKSGADTGMFSNPGIDFNIAIISLIIIIVSGILAGLLPAYRAVKIKPIEALRSE
ncbi:MAG: ABC transporter permease [Bacteroidetes bacterium]|nr:MAG: ABC transporter permease [Bacteroidota bacterium]